MNGYVSKLVTAAYRKVTRIGYFDIKEGNAPIDAADKLEIIPDKYHDYVDKTNKGCCLLFATYMLRELKGSGVTCYIVLTPEGNGVRGSLLYYDDNGEMMVANPVEDIEFFTAGNIAPEDRKDYYVEDSATMIVNGNTHDDSRIPLQEFADRYGDVRLLTSFRDDDAVTFGQAYGRAYTGDEMVIASPTQDRPLEKK